MRLYLVRHGESVDNVAGLYAGVRDSPLTAHGVLQARRLGAHLANISPTIGPVWRIFSSNLRRAADTAQAVFDAQASKHGAEEDTHPRALVEVPDLRERDFRSAEGTKYGTPHADAESFEEMNVRAVRFVREHLAPTLDACETWPEGEFCVVVVSHGLILNVLTHEILSRYSSDKFFRRLQSRTKQSGYIASLSNTGYVEMRSVNVSAPFASTHNKHVVGPALTPKLASGNVSRLSLDVTAINCVDHLQGLKKTRGGIGSAAFDSKQKTISSFYRPISKKGE